MGYYRIEDFPTDPPLAECPPTQYVHGVLIGVLAAVACVAVCYILSRCIVWYGDPESRPSWLRRSRSEDVRPAADEDMESLTRRLATTLDSRKWMLAFQYYVELQPRSPKQRSLDTSQQFLRIELQHGSNTRALTSTSNVKGHQPSKSTRRDDLAMRRVIQKRHRQNVAEERANRYRQVMAEVAEEYRLATNSFIADEDCYRWLKGTSNLVAERRNSEDRDSDDESAALECPLQPEECGLTADELEWLLRPNDPVTLAPIQRSSTSMEDVPSVKVLDRLWLNAPETVV